MLLVVVEVLAQVGVVVGMLVVYSKISVVAVAFEEALVRGVGLIVEDAEAWVVAASAAAPGRSPRNCAFSIFSVNSRISR